MVTVTNFGPVACPKCGREVCCAKRATDYGWQLNIVKDNVAYYCPECVMEAFFDPLFDEGENDV